MDSIIEMNQYLERKKEEKEAEAQREVERTGEVYERACAAVEADDSLENVEAMLAAGADLAWALCQTEAGQYLMEAEEKRNKALQEKFKEVFEAAPDLPFARIKYFCPLMLDLVPAVMEGDRKDRSVAFDDFFYVFTDGIDMAVSAWSCYDQRVEDCIDELRMEYPILQPDTIRENIESLLTEILQKMASFVISDDTARKDFLREYVKLFQVCRELVYMFGEEVEKRREARLQETES